MIKGIFFDIDGTLLSKVDGSLPNSTRQALSQLQAQGIKIFIASGRHLVEIQEQPLHDIHFDGYICLNGQLGLDANKETIFSFPIQENDQKELVKLFNLNNIPMVIVEEKRLYINTVNENVRKAQQAIASDIPPIEQYHGDSIYQVTSFVNDDKAKELACHLSHCKVTRWNSYGIDIISDTGGKAFGIEKMLKLHNLSKQEIMVFGDGENDMDMIQYAQIGIAMKDATQDLKNVADYITDTAHNDGIVKALQHYKIIQD